MRSYCSASEASEERESTFASFRASSDCDGLTVALSESVSSHGIGSSAHLDKSLSDTFLFRASNQNLCALWNCPLRAQCQAGFLPDQATKRKRILFPGISRSDWIKKSSRSTDLHLLL